MRDAFLALFLIGSCVKDSDSSEPEAAAPEAHIQATEAEVVKMLNGARARHRFDEAVLFFGEVVGEPIPQAPILSSRRCDEFVSVQCLCNMGTRSGASQNRDPEVSYSGVVLRTLFQTLGFLMAGFLLAKISVGTDTLPRKQKQKGLWGFTQFQPNT